MDGATGFKEIYHYNLTGIIKVLKPEGYGFIVPDEPVTETRKDVFFHATAMLDDDVEWSQLRVGQKVHIGSAVVNEKGVQGVDITLIRPNSRARHAR